MSVDSIHLSRYRNHAETRLAGTGHFNLLTGENGAGKTNILEAISLFSPGRGLRRASPELMAQADASSKETKPSGFAVGATLTAADGGEVRLGTFCDAARPTRRLVRINESASSAVALGEWVAISWLTPAMDRLFAESAGQRRQYMDRLAVALDPAHAGHAARYTAAVRERNRLLGDDRPPEPAWLDAIEAQMASHGAALSAGRAHLIAQLSDALDTAPDGPFARPQLNYEPGGPTNQQSLIDAWRAARSRDLAAGRTLTGPHRDELKVTLAAKGMPAALASTGEQKAMLVAITLAHADLAAKGRASLLLLDEVAAHLDPLRREALFERLRSGDAQVWLTGTEGSPFSDILAEAAHWRIEAGQALKV